MNKLSYRYSVDNTVNHLHYANQTRLNVSFFYTIITSANVNKVGYTNVLLLNWICFEYYWNIFGQCCQPVARTYLVINLDQVAKNQCISKSTQKWKYLYSNNVIEPSNRISRSGGSEDSIPVGGNYLQLNALNLQTSAPISEVDSYKPTQRLPTGRFSRPSWVSEENNKSSFASAVRRNPPRILEALPSYPQGANGSIKFGITSIQEKMNDKVSTRLLHNETVDRCPPLLGPARSPTYWRWRLT